jgi:5-methylcytosine-specific restriction endonuclease McrA
MYMREWNKKDPETIKARLRKYAAEHRDEAKQRWAEWRKANPRRQLDYNNSYDRAHPDVARARVHKRLARKKGAEGHYTQADWDEIVARQDGKCLLCGEQPERLTVDHIVALAKGGSNWPDNLQGLCHSCNSRKGARDMDELVAA